MLGKDASTKVRKPEKLCRSARTAGSDCKRAPLVPMADSTSDFIASSWEMVNGSHPEIGWSPDGTNIIVANPERLAANVLPAIPQVASGAGGMPRRPDWLEATESVAESVPEAAHSNLRALVPIPEGRLRRMRRTKAHASCSNSAS